ncbi:excalibur calcium-binding domain-containing protein [uncultured Granulicatella sp.]|uniref:excalibur calcium-binding domain-containing protein n=1 Tax=uncultured Granulicatella sp. TaxID=316089 RepID=UPI0028DC1F38|nr:excalibur calcium-binding domain-containing protein [uncultured Granulicatella sp.]
MKKVKGLVVFSAAATLLALGLEQKVEARVYFHSCKEAWAAGYGNIAIGEEGYSKHLDRDGDGVACEIGRSKGAYRPKTADGTPLNKQHATSSSSSESNGSDESTLSGWQQNGGNWYYYEGNTAVTDWKNISGTWYYFDGSGVMSTNWEKVNGAWYYFSTDGAMRTSWQKVSGAWYYMDNSGAMQTDWKKISNAWYYFNADGVMQANRWVGDYYLGSSGAMLVNTKTPDGYRVDASGKWIQNK